ncbi:MAG TPA: trypsin-like peptidase domain-containing protein [Candidatus Saccharimonadales bacterium]|nr:trypsin-like peptidase domain-containing protein [Candidatus Saccharimonadales bacterium]
MDNESSTKAAVSQPGAVKFTPQWAPKPPKKPVYFGPDSPRIKFLAMAMLIILSISFGFLGGWLANRQNGKPTVQKQQVVLKTQGQLISSIAKNVGQSVVSITTTQTAQNIFGMNSQLEGAGTGIVLSSEGLIITNRHVVPQGTSNVTVTLSDGTEFDNVTVVGRTSESDSLDVAFLKIGDTKGKKLTAASIGDSSKMNVGDPVVAIGNALGQFQNTVTSGIISGYGRSLQASDASGGGSENLEDLFQTDAAINEGNSGGPLVNLDGEVIGINTAVAANGAQNIGFSIPINNVSGLIRSVKQTGKLERPFLGVVYLPVTNDLAKQYNLSVNRGAYIPTTDSIGSDTIINDGPAAKAGLKEGDVITKLNDVAIDQANSLSALINRHAVGDKISLTVLRDGKQQNVTVTLGSAPTG